MNQRAASFECSHFDFVQSIQHCITIEAFYGLNTVTILFNPHLCNNHFNIFGALQMARSVNKTINHFVWSIFVSIYVMHLVVIIRWKSLFYPPHIMIWEYNIINIILECVTNILCDYNSNEICHNVPIPLN